MPGLQQELQPRPMRSMKQKSEPQLQPRRGERLKQKSERRPQPRRSKRQMPDGIIERPSRHPWRGVFRWQSLSEVHSPEDPLRPLEEAEAEALTGAKQPPEPEQQQQQQPPQEEEEQEDQEEVTVRQWLQSGSLFCL